MVDEQELERQNLRKEFDDFLQKAQDLYRSDPSRVSSIVEVFTKIDQIESEIQKRSRSDFIQSDKWSDCKKWFLLKVPISATDLS